ncbi:putative holin, partial [Bilophila wadsworthia]
MKLFIRLLNPRFQFFFFAVLALFVTGLVAFCSPEQFPIVRYKLSLGMLAAVIAVFFDMAAFPYASPDSYLDDDWRKTPDADR